MRGKRKGGGKEGKERQRKGIQSNMHLYCILLGWIKGTSRAIQHCYLLPSSFNSVLCFTDKNTIS